MSAAEKQREEDFLRNASLERRTAAITAINHHRRRGMSRRRLIEIYGDELVNAVLGYDPALA